MLPSECPYPETNPEYPPSHPLGTSHASGYCSQCQRYFRRCPDCQAANRWLARFCRNCGHSLTPQTWLPDVADGPLQALPWSLPQQWRPHLECGFRPTWAALLDGRLFVVGSRGELRHLIGERLDTSLPNAAPPTSPPCYMHGFLAIPGEDQITLIDLLEARGSNRRVQRLRGSLLCPIACDQGQWLAALVMDGDNRSLQMFRLQGARLQLTWNQVIEGGGPQPKGIPRLFWCDETLVYQSEEGQLSGLEPSTGSERFRLNCPCPPSPLSPWVRGSDCFWGGQDGSLWWLRGRPELQLHQLSGAQDFPLLALGAGPRDLIASFGRSLIRVQLENTRCETVELPHYCTVSPWIGEEEALVLSQEGQLYQLSLGTQTFQVETTDKMPGPFSGTLLPPVYAGHRWYMLDSDGRLFISS